MITADTLSQRYVLLSDMATEEPELRGMVHDDGCHVRAFAQTHRREDNEISKRLSSPGFYYIIDRPHSRGHVDPVCKAECFPDVEKNAAFLADFPTPHLRVGQRGAVLSSAHGPPHAAPVVFFLVSECVEVHNELREQRRQEARTRQERKRRRADEAGSSA